MFKFTLIALSVLSAVASASSCGNCSPQCLDCRIRGYSRLSDDQSTADCYLEYALTGIGPICAPIGDGENATALYPGTPVCRRQRCTLENGERCRLKRLNEDTCMSLISSANSALNTSLNGCFAYVENIPFNFSCPDGYTAACRYSNIPDILPVSTGDNPPPPPAADAPIHKAAHQIDTATNYLDPQGVYSVLPDVPVLRTQILSPLLANNTSCPDTITDENGNVLEFITEGCLPVYSTLLNSDIAALLNGKTCNAGYDPLVVLGYFGCYKVIDIPNPNSNLCEQLNPPPVTVTASMPTTTITATIVPTLTVTIPLPEGKASQQTGTPIYVESFPKCFYRLPNKDVDPAGCQSRQ